ncbi:hypothetical protein QJQ45_010616 [Haematococcus lacustris]|nr:hypothetical protein QJQ45_010616 [Haematococcus lacustris]
MPTHSAHTQSRNTHGAVVEFAHEQLDLFTSGNRTFDAAVQGTGIAAAASRPASRRPASQLLGLHQFELLDPSAPLLPSESVMDSERTLIQPGDASGLHVVLRDDVLADDQGLTDSLTEALTGLCKRSQVHGAKGLAGCVGHSGCPGPEDLAAMELRLQRHQAELSRRLQAEGGGVEAEAEAAAVSAAAAAAQLEARHHTRSTEAVGEAAAELRAPTAVQAGVVVQHGDAVPLSKPDIPSLRQQLLQTGQRLQRLSLAREQAEQGGAAQLLGLLLARCWRNLLQHVALHRASWAWQQLLVGPQDPRDLLTGARLAGEEGRGSNDGGQGFVSRTQEQQQQERHLGALGESVVSSQAQPRGQLGDTSPKDQGVSVRLPSSFAQPRSSQQTAQGLCLGGWGPGLLPRRQGPAQPQCTREPDAESRACCKAQCLAEQAGMAVQLAELTMQLDSCQLVQARMCVELEVAVAQAAESHAQAMAVSRAAEARVAALQAELDSSRQEAREARQLAQALRQGCNAEQQASKSGPRGHQGGAEQAAQVSRLEAQVALLEGQPEALRAVGPEELQQIVARMESALAAARAVQLQVRASAGRGELEGHQTCCECGEKLTVCPICRTAVTLRIRTFNS